MADDIDSIEFENEFGDDFTSEDEEELVDPYVRAVFDKIGVVDKATYLLAENYWADYPFEELLAAARTLPGTVAGNARHWSAISYIFYRCKGSIAKLLWAYIRGGKEKKRTLGDQKRKKKEKGMINVDNMYDYASDYYTDLGDPETPGNPIRAWDLAKYTALPEYASNKERNKELTNKLRYYVLRYFDSFIQTRLRHAGEEGAKSIDAMKAVDPQLDFEDTRDYSRMDTETEMNKERKLNQVQLDFIAHLEALRDGATGIQRKTTLQNQINVATRALANKTVKQIVKETGMDKWSVYKKARELGEMFHQFLVEQGQEE